METLLYYLFVYPLELPMGLCFGALHQATGSYGTSVVLLAILVNTALLPLYYMAERWKLEEHTIRQKMEWELASIRKHSRGRERFYYTREVHRRFGYGPAHSLKVSAGFLVQVPFFFAAYHLLSHFAGWQGIGFLLISDLSLPDHAIHIAGLRLNALPLAMTGLNFASVITYTTHMSRRERAPLWLLALAFLVALYDSPAGLVLYWTVGNAFSLVKNAVGQRLSLDFLAGSAAGAMAHTRVSPPHDRPGRVGSAAWGRGSLLARMPDSARLYGLAVGALSMLVFLNGPLVLCEASTDPGCSPRDAAPVFMLNTAAVFMASSVAYFVVGRCGRKILTIVVVFLCATTLGYSSALDVGFLNQLVLPKPEWIELGSWARRAEWGALALALIATAALTIRYRRAAERVAAALFVSTVVMAAVALTHSFMDREEDGRVALAAGELPAAHQKVLAFSREQNVLVVVLDGFSGGYISTLQQHAPHVLSAFSGFVWYANTLTTNAGTLGTVAALVGGDNYTVQAINSRTVSSVAAEIVEAYKVFPDAFIPRGYEVSYVGPKFTRECSGIDSRVHCTETRPYGTYYQEHYSAADSPRTDRTPFILTAISAFKVSPYFLKSRIYDEGAWLGMNDVPTSAIRWKLPEWGFLRTLAAGITADSPSKTFKLLHLDLPHPLNALDDECRMNPESASFFSESTCGLKELGALFEHMKSLQVYDNTKIIVISDHGWWAPNPMFPSSFHEVMASGFMGHVVGGFVQALLLVKDFGANGALRRSDALMSNADLPAIACSVVGSCQGVAADPLRRPDPNRKLIFNNIDCDDPADTKFDVREQYEVAGSIFDPANWRRTDLPELRP